jgi:hypothetical protein
MLTQQATAKSILQRCERAQKREAEINQALQQEEARRAAVIKNMHRLRQLRLQRSEKPKANR